MSKRAEEYANAQYPQMWVNKTPTSCEKVDYNEYARRAARIAYEQAEKDLALTAYEIRLIFNKVRIKQSMYNTTEGCYQEVADWFNEQRKI